MEIYQTLTLVISLLAISVSVVSMIRTRKISEKQIALEKVAAKLSKKQLELINKEEVAKTKALVDMELHSEIDKHRLYFVNNGYANASEVDFELKGEHFPFIDDEYQRKFPLKTLRPGKDASLYLIDEFGRPDHYEIEYWWEDPDGTERKESQTIYLK